MVILAVSDIHLGYSQSNVDEFDAFLQTTIDRTDVDILVILGDFIDMWRRDISGLFLENHQILQSLLTLQQKKTVYYVAGNHDYHLVLGFRRASLHSGSFASYAHSGTPRRSVQLWRSGS